MTKSVHDKIAEKLARKFNTEYKSNKGIDIVTNAKVIEVETKKNSMQQGIDQVVRSSKPRYIAVNKINVKNAVDATEGTGVGVMGPSGIIVKRASRKG
ncbi:MAG: hypothetical protein ABH864_06560 [archaeon]